MRTEEEFCAPQENRLLEANSAADTAEAAKGEAWKQYLSSAGIPKHTPADADRVQAAWANYEELRNAAEDAHGLVAKAEGDLHDAHMDFLDLARENRRKGRMR